MHSPPGWISPGSQTWILWRLCSVTYRRSSASSLTDTGPQKTGSAWEAACVRGLEMLGEILDQQPGAFAGAVFVLVDLQPLLGPLRQRRFAVEHLVKFTVRVEHLYPLVAPVGDSR